MSGEAPTHALAVDDARRDLARAEAGDPAGVDKIDRLRRADSASVDGAAQEASDGPEGLGLSR